MWHAESSTRRLAQYDKAEADFEKAYDLNPNQTLSAAAQGLVAVQANDLDHALASIQSKLARKSERPAPASTCRQMYSRKKGLILVHLSFGSRCARQGGRSPCSRDLPRLAPSWPKCTCKPGPTRKR